MRKVFLFILILVTSAGCLNEKKQAETIFQHYLDRKTGVIRNYSKESSLALWNASVSGKESDYKKLIDIELDFSKSNQQRQGAFSPDNFRTITQNVFTNEEDFELLRKLKYSGLITDTLLSRQLIYLYHTFTSSQIESDKYKKLLEHGVKLSHSSSTLKYEFEGKSYSSLQLDSIRKQAKDNQTLEKIAEAYCIGAQKIVPEIIQLVKERNEVAHDWGFPDYYHVEFEAKDESPEKVKSLIDEIELKTRGRFMEAKREMDLKLAKYFGIKVEDLRPWHYADDKISFLSAQYSRTLDSQMKPIDAVKLTADYMNNLGLNIQKVIDKSELSNGNMNAMINIDINTDVRLIGRITNSFDGLTKMLHLAGHAAHYTNISEDIPYLLQGPSLIITEGVARYFENMAFNPDWLSAEMAFDELNREKISSILQHFREVDQLFRLRKQMVMAEFEREFYANPDQDLDSLWRTLNLKYLDISYPEEKNSGYWATNRYFTSLSCYMQNYILANIVAAQLKHAIENKVLNAGIDPKQGNKETGEYLKKKLFNYGDLYPWEKLVEISTGEPVTSQYYVNELIGLDKPKSDGKKLKVKM